MSDLATSLTSAAAGQGRDHMTLMSLKLQSQAEQLVVSLVDQSVQQTKVLNQQSALNAGGHKGTQVNMTV
ncbi:MAG: hypothetical protein HQL45_08340 [Alphaproteobacteria bacterium]|jgi:hypothetical protein|nr:hypothetical protein [Alphaproteobacteria bacterium]MBF0355688.1 hypothetical protein [Alphaproteobacteria bacterium]